MKSTKTALNRLKIKRFLKATVLLLAFIAVYGVSLFLIGLKETNVKLLTLIFYGFIGFFGFYLIGFTVKGITALISKSNQKKRKKLLKKLKPIRVESATFSYDAKIGLEGNFKEYLQCLKNAFTLTAEASGFKGKYLYLNFTFQDALSFFNNTVNLVEGKVDYLLGLPVINVFNLQDKPVKLIETTLNSLIENEGEKHRKINVILEKSINFGIKYLLKEKIDKSLNEVVSYVTLEWYLIYSKNNKKLIKKLAKANGDLIKSEATYD